MPTWLIRLAKAVLALPIHGLYWLYRAGLFKYDTGSCALALVPRMLGVWWRRCWYQRTLKHCGANLVVHWMAVILVPETSVGDLVAVGSFSTVIHADIGDNVMISPRVSVVRGAHQHGFARLDIPMTFQPYSILAGLPAKVIGQRGPALEDGVGEASA